MSKVIAVMDKPKECRHCIFLVCEHCTSSQKTRKYYCNLKESNKIYKEIVKEKFDYREEVHLSNCPLREVPEKRSTEYNPARNPYITEGYNACIDEILKGSEEP